MSVPGGMGFPGGTSLSALTAYPSIAPDGLAGGTPHLHTVSTEAYVVTGGTGLLHTLDASGFTETPLSPGAVVWFTAGVIHRAVNTGDLQLFVIMQNAGLPEAGDAVMTFPPDVLADDTSYHRLARLPDSEHSASERLAAAMNRRDQAVAGFDILRRAVTAHGPGALDDFYAHAARIVRPRVGHWRSIWQQSALSLAELTGDQLDSLEQGTARHLQAGRATSAGYDEALGMCGHLHSYDTTDPQSRSHSPKQWKVAP